MIRGGGGLNTAMAPDTVPGMDPPPRSPAAEANGALWLGFRTGPTGYKVAARVAFGRGLPSDRPDQTGSAKGAAPGRASTAKSPHKAAWKHRAVTATSSRV